MKTIEQIKSELFRNVSIDISAWNDKDCDEYINATLSIEKVKRTIKEKKELILDLEYNYIQNTSLTDLSSIYDQYPSLEWIKGEIEFSRIIF